MERIVKYSLIRLKRLISAGVAEDISSVTRRNPAHASFTRIAYSSGLYGITGLLLRDDDENLYVVIGRVPALDLF